LGFATAAGNNNSSIFGKGIRRAKILGSIISLLRVTKQPKTLSEAADGLDNEVIFDVLHAGLVSTLGVETTSLLFKTMKLIYNFEEREMPSNLERFDELMARILGLSTATIIRQNFFEEFKKRLKKIG
jgi:hypothetical protein